MESADKLRFLMLGFILVLFLTSCGEPPALQPAAPSTQSNANTSSTAKTVAAAATPTPIVSIPLSEAPAATRALFPASAPKDAEILPAVTPGIRGGQLVIPILNDPKTFNTLLVDSISDQNIEGLQVTPLYNYDWQRQMDIPGLAKSWNYDEQKHEWIFHLREGLRWSDGQPLTADDFLFFTQLCFDPKIPNDYNFSFRLEPKEGSPRYEFSAPDPLTFVAKIPGVDSFALINLGQLRPLPRHVLEKPWKEGRFNTVWGQNVRPEELVVSGPFKLAQLRPGESVIFERNPYYYRYDAKGQQLPYVDRLVLLVIKDMEAQELRFLAGDFDILDASQGGSGIKPDNLANFRQRAKTGNFTIYPLGGGFDINFFSFNQNLGGAYTDAKGARMDWQPTRRGETPPPGLAGFKPYIDPVKRGWFSNLEFRIACSELTNRKKIIDNVMFGQGIELFGFEPAANHGWCNPEIKKFPYNPESAKKRLEKLGFIDRNGDGLREDPAGNTIRLTMLTNRENNIREKVIQLLKADFRAAGIDLQTDIQDFNTLVTKFDRTFDYESYLLGLGAGVPPHPALATNVIPTSGRLHFGYPLQKVAATEWEAEIDKLYSQMKLTFDIAEQRRLYNRIQAIFAEQQAAIFLFSPNYNVAVRNTIGNLRPAALRGSLIHNIDELYIKK